MPYKTLVLTLLLWLAIPAAVAQGVILILLGEDRLLELVRDNRATDLVRHRILQVSLLASTASLCLFLLWLLIRRRRRPSPRVLDKNSIPTEWGHPLPIVPESLEDAAPADHLDPAWDIPTPPPEPKRVSFRRRVRLARRWGMRLSPLLLLPAVICLLHWRLFSGQGVLLLVATLLTTYLFERTIRLAGKPGWARPLPKACSLARPWQGLALLWLMLLPAMAYMTYFVLLNHYRFQTASYDLGIFDNLMWQLVHGEWFRSTPAYGKVNLTHITRHANFVAVFFAPFYALVQRAETLLILQTVLALSAAIPIYLTAKRRLGSAWMALAFSYSYLIYAPLHGALFYDFHFLTTVPAFISWTVYFFESGNRLGWIFFGVVSLLTREDVGPGLALLAFYYLLSSGRSKAALWGGLVAGTYFLLTKFVVMPLHSSPGDRGTFAYLFQRLIPEGKDGLGAVLQTIVLNPLFTLSTLVKEEKFIYLLQVLLPVAFLPFRNRKAWLPLMASILFTVFPSDPSLYSISFQYTSHYSSYVFMGSIFVLSEWLRRDPSERTRVVAAIASMCLASTLVSYHFGAMFQRHTFRGGFRQVEFRWSDEDKAQRADFLALAKQIPAHASVVSTETEVPHLSNRHRSYTMRVGVDDADYILARIDEVMGGEPRNRLLDGLRANPYGFVERRGKFALWKKGGDPAKNAEGLRIIQVDRL